MNALTLAISSLSAAGESAPKASIEVVRGTPGQVKTVGLFLIFLTASVPSISNSGVLLMEAGLVAAKSAGLKGLKGSTATGAGITGLAGGMLALVREGRQRWLKLA